MRFFPSGIRGNLPGELAELLVTGDLVDAGNVEVEPPGKEFLYEKRLSDPAPPIDGYEFRLIRVVTFLQDFLLLLPPDD